MTSNEQIEKQTLFNVKAKHYETKVYNIYRH